MLEEQLNALFPSILAEIGTSVVFTREERGDGLHKRVQLDSPSYRAVVASFRVTNPRITRDERGTISPLSYVALVANLPRTLSAGVPAVRAGDTMRDAQGNTYRVSSDPTYFTEVLCEVLCERVSLV